MRLHLRSRCSRPLEKDVPKAVQPGYFLLTKDLEKAYNKVMMDKNSRKYQCGEYVPSYSVYSRVD